MPIVAKRRRSMEFKGVPLQTRGNNGPVGELFPRRGVLSNLCPLFDHETLVWLVAADAQPACARRSTGFQPQTLDPYISYIYIYKMLSLIHI